MDFNELTEGLYLEEYAKGQEKELATRIQNEGLKLSYKKLMTDPDGKVILWDILSYCGVFNNAMTGNSKTYFNLGMQSVGQYVMLMLNLGQNLDDVVGFQKLRPEKKDG